MTDPAPHHDGLSQSYQLRKSPLSLVGGIVYVPRNRLDPCLSTRGCHPSCEKEVLRFSVGIVHQSSLWLTGFRVGRRFVGFDLGLGFDFGIAQILPSEALRVYESSH